MQKREDETKCPKKEKVGMTEEGTVQEDKCYAKKRMRENE